MYCVALQNVHLSIWWIWQKVWSREAEKEKKMTKKLPMSKNYSDKSGVITCKMALNDQGA